LEWEKPLRRRTKIKKKPTVKRASHARKHREFMGRAIELSIHNVKQNRGGPFAAVIVKDGVIVAEGVNLVTSTMDPTAHAEVVVIREACRVLGTHDLAGCMIYTSCEPCPMCMGAIYWSRPARVFFGNTAEDAAAAGFDDAFIHRELKKPHHKKKIGMTGMMRGEALEAFRRWLEHPDKIRY
jgi:tRNA(Arg) A34 adenosine deaminase TadA